MENILTIDGSQGEGGGQILRTSLALSAITGRPIRIEKIRAGREVPGLRRQHLTCVRAAAAICGATVSEIDVGASELTFRPGPIRGGDYRFDVGTAGAATLVAQTVLPALLKADAPSSVTITGGTHVPFAPIWEFFAETFLPELRRMGAEIEAELPGYGFNPAAGGEIRLSIKPFDEVKANRDWSMTTLGAYRGGKAVGVVSSIPLAIAKDEAERIAHRLWEIDLAQEVREVESPGPGNYCYVRLDFERASVVFSGIGTWGRSRKAVANGVVVAVSHFTEAVKAGAAVERHLADQLLVPLAVLLGRRGGSPEELGMAIEKETPHYTTNRNVIRRFLC